MSDHLISIKEAESDLLACATYLAERIKSGDGHAEAMLGIVPRHLAKGDVDLAAELANTVDDPFTRDRLLILVAEKCAELDDDEYALQLVEAIEEYALQSQARERIALLEAAKGRFDKAREIADEMDHRDMIYAAIAIKQAAGGDEAASSETLKEIAFPGAIVFAYISMAAAKLEAGEHEKAVELLEKAALAADEIEHDEEKIRNLCDTGNLFIEAKRNDRAIETFEKARSHAETLDNIHRDAFLGAVALGFLRSGSLDLADRALDVVTDKTQIASALLGFSREFWRKDERVDAIEALEESYAILKSQSDAETRDSRAKFALFTSIAAQFAGFEKGERAINIAQEIIDENEQMSALGQIAEILTIQKNDDLARQAICAIPDDANRMFALVGQSDAAKSNDEMDKAKGFLDEAAALAETVERLAPRSSAYNEIAKRLNDYGETERSQEILRMSLETITTIRDESSQSVALGNLANFYKELDLPMSDFEKSSAQAMIAGHLR